MLSLNVKLKSVLQRGSTFTCDLSYTASILLASLNRLYARKIVIEIHPNEGKEEEREKERGGRKEEKRKQSNGCNLSFIMAKLTEKVYLAVTFSKMRLDIHCK